MGERGVLDRRKEGRKIVFTDFTFLASSTNPWTGNHKLEVSLSPAGIQLPQRPSSSTRHPPLSSQDTYLEIPTSFRWTECSLHVQYAHV